MSDATPIQARIFISYAREDAARVNALHQRLKAHGFDPWLDREHLVPGQQWEPVLKRALKGSDFVLVCLSETSINKRGFLRREIKQALEQAQEKLEDDVYLIPARLDDCAVPDILEHLQWVDLFEDDGWEDLLRAFEYGLRKQGKSLPQPRQLQPESTPPPLPQSAPQPLLKVSLVPEDLGAGGRLELVFVPGGEFEMGSTEADARAAWEDAKRYNKNADWDWFKRELPQHRVRLSPFWMSKYQVTQTQWQTVMGKLPEVEEKLRGPQRPVVNVSWEDATEFCEKLAAQTGRAYRLPTEAEWEYACRAGTTTPFAFGETITPEYVNYNGNYPYGQAAKGLYRAQTVDVGSLGVANDFGLYDMHGNVWEWCRDWYGADYYEVCRQQGTVVDPPGPSQGQYRVLRGGSWIIHSWFCRSAFRNHYDARYFNFNVGVRVVVPARTA